VAALGAGEPDSERGGACGTSMRDLRTLARLRDWRVSTDQPAPNGLAWDRIGNSDKAEYTFFHAVRNAP
jgi:hypothetical protein